MKKLILISALALTLLSCSEDSSNTTGSCSCGVVVEKIYFNSIQPFTKLRIKNNCTQEVKTITVSGNVGVLNQQYCY